MCVYTCDLVEVGRSFCHYVCVSSSNIFEFRSTCCICDCELQRKKYTNRSIENHCIDAHTFNNIPMDTHYLKSPMLKVHLILCYNSCARWHNCNNVFHRNNVENLETEFKVKKYQCESLECAYGIFWRKKIGLIFRQVTFDRSWNNSFFLTFCWTSQISTHSVLLYILIEFRCSTVRLHSRIWHYWYVVRLMENKQQENLLKYFHFSHIKWRLSRF